MIADEWTVDTSEGPARVTRAEPRQPIATIVLGHGAGGGPEALELRALADALPERHITVLRVEQPWRLAGKKIAPRPEVLDRAWLGVLNTLDPAGPLVVGGRSAGARVACRTATASGAHGCVALAFPLHPPGRPEKSRVDELLGVGVPTLVVQGERDTFGGPSEFPDLPDLPDPSGHRTVASRLLTVPAAGHELRIPKRAGGTQRAASTQQEALDLIVGTVAEWIHQLSDPPRG